MGKTDGWPEDEIVEIRLSKADLKGLWHLVNQENNDVIGWGRGRCSDIDLPTLKRVIQAFTDAVDGVITVPRDTCTWSEDEDGLWSGPCGVAFLIRDWEVLEPTPSGAGYVYCPQCGGRVVADPYNGPEEEEEEGEVQQDLSPLTKTLLWASDLDQGGRTDEALDLVYERIDEMLLADEFEAVSEALTQLDPGLLSPTLIGGILTVTLPARESCAPGRSLFFDRAYEALASYPDREVLLTGLRP